MPVQKNFKLWDLWNLFWWSRAEFWSYLNWLLFGNPEVILAHPDFNLVYVLDQTQNVTNIWGYVIHPVLVEPIKLPNAFGAFGAGGMTPADMVYMEYLSILLVTDFDSNLKLFQVDTSTGALIDVGPLNAGQNPNRIAVHPNKPYIYITNTKSKDISTYTFEPPGFPNILPSTPAGDGATGIAVDPSGRFTYVANSKDNSISEYLIDQDNGSLVESHLPLKTGNQPEDVKIHPTGKFVYVTNRQDSTVSQFEVSSDAALDFGLLTPMNPNAVFSGTPQPPTEPVAMAFHPNGEFLYVANKLDDTVTLFNIDQNAGLLSKQFDKSVGNSPVHLAVSPNGKRLYVVCFDDATVEQFAIDPTDGSIGLQENILKTTNLGPVRVAIINRPFSVW